MVREEIGRPVGGYCSYPGEKQIKVVLKHGGRIGTSVKWKDSRYNLKMQNN